MTTAQSVLQVLGKSAGLAAAGLLLLQLPLAARAAVLDRVLLRRHRLRVHHVLGGVAVLCALAHPLLLYATPLYAVGDLDPSDWPVLVGAAGLLLVAVVASSSLWRELLELPFGTWRALHAFVPVAAALVAVHAAALGSDLVHPAMRWTWVGLFCLFGLGWLPARFLGTRRPGK